MRESRTYGSVRAKAEWLSYSTTLRDRRWPPCCFTEMGLAMLSSVLGSKPASAVNIEIMRTFTRLREFLASHAELARRVQSLERASHHHAGQLEFVFEAILELSAPVVLPGRKRHKLAF